MSTSLCAALSPAPRSAASWPPPTTRLVARHQHRQIPDRTTCPSGTRAPGLPLPGHRGSPAHLGPGPRRARRHRPTTWPGSGNSSTPRASLPDPRGRRPVHRLPDQVPDQADRRLPPRRHRRRSGMRPGWLRRCDTSRARRGGELARYGIQPKNARPGLAPGRCKSKAHDPDHFGYAGRRVLVSRKWSGKTLDDHRADRKDWLLKTLGVSATDPAGTPGSSSDLPIPIIWTTQTAAARRRRPAPMAGRPCRGQAQGRRCHRTVIFRQLGGRHDGRGRRRRRRLLDVNEVARAAWDRATVRPAPDRGTTDRVSQARPSRAHQRSCPSRVHQGRACPSGDISHSRKVA